SDLPVHPCASASLCNTSPSPSRGGPAPPGAADRPLASRSTSRQWRRSRPGTAARRPEAPASRSSPSAARSAIGSCLLLPWPASASLSLAIFHLPVDRRRREPVHLPARPADLHLIHLRRPSE